MPRPVIGLTLDSEPSGGYSKFPWYALRENYCGAVAAAGGLPLPVPHEPDLPAAYLDRLDGLVITGGDFDIDPALFGASAKHATVKTKARRTKFEQAIVGGALAHDLPILGICGGQQLLHVMLGGRLIQHIPDQLPNALAHEQPNPRDQTSHAVTIRTGTQLATILGDPGVIQVNSAHHQAAADAPDELVINAVAPDGVIEGIEAPARRFCLGVQWHPEFFITRYDRRLFDAFVAACM